MLTRSRIITAAIVCAAALGAVTTASAAPLTFSCPDPANCNGATYALGITNTTNLGGGNYQYTLVYAIDTTGYVDGGTAAPDYIQAIAFKSVVSNFANMTLTTAPGGAANWVLTQGQLDAKNCFPNGNSPAQDTCETASSTMNSGFGVPVSPATQYFWTFTFTSTDDLSTANNPTGEIKFRYVDGALKKGAFNKVGSLGSFDVPLQLNACVGATCTPPPPPPSVPEPASMFLLGAGLLGGLRVMRRQHP